MKKLYTAIFRDYLDSRYTTGMIIVAASSKGEAMSTVNAFCKLNRIGYSRGIQTCAFKDYEAIPGVTIPLLFPCIIRYNIGRELI